MKDVSFIGPPAPKKEWKLSDKLSDHFSLDELTRSQTAIRKNIDNTPTDIEIELLRALCDTVLEPVRVHFNKSVNISSGFRSVELNTAIGGSGTSQHCKGETADFTVSSIPLLEVWEWVVLYSDIDFDQIILEFHNMKTKTGGWIHISHKKWGENRNMIMVASKVNKATKYSTFTKQQVINGEHLAVIKGENV